MNQVELIPNSGIIVDKWSYPPETLFEKILKHIVISLEFFIHWLPLVLIVQLLFLVFYKNKTSSLYKTIKKILFFLFLIYLIAIIRIIMFFDHGYDIFWHPYLFNFL